MTSKQAEHWLIENDFEYVEEGSFPYWQHKKNRFAAVSDRMVTETPKEAISFASKKLDTM